MPAESTVDGRFEDGTTATTTTTTFSSGSAVPTTAPTNPSAASSNSGFLVPPLIERLFVDRDFFYNYKNSTFFSTDHGDVRVLVSSATG